MISMFFVIENKSNMTQATEGWSIPIEVLEGGPIDYRKMDIIKRPDDEGVILTSLDDGGIEIYELDWFGQVERNLSIDEDFSHIKLVDLGYDEDSYFLYISDRKILESYSIDIENFTLGEKSLVSQSSEQFSVSMGAVIVGDDHITQIISDGEVVASFEDYDDLKRVSILSTEDGIFATMDTVMGSNIIAIQGQEIQSRELIAPSEEKTLGYLQDIYYQDGLLTVLSGKHHIQENFPSSYGMWQLNGDLDILNNELWYHNRTSLRPIITHVRGEEIDYILGVLTRQDENSDQVMDKPHLQSGTFTNILHFTRGNKELKSYDRLTNTREYPVGYEYIKGRDGDIIIWADRVEESSNIRLAGKGEDWISYAQEDYSVDYYQIASEILMSFVASLVWGIFFGAMDLLDYILLIIAFGLIVFMLNRRLTMEENKRERLIFSIVAIAAISFKFYISAIGNEGIQAYGHIYPSVLGNSLTLGIISLLTSACSLFLIHLWYNRNKDLSNLVHISVFIGFEIYFYVFTVMVYVVSAMSKMSVMI